MGEKLRTFRIGIWGNGLNAIVYDWTNLYGQFSKAQDTLGEENEFSGKIWKEPEMTLD